MGVSTHTLRLEWAWTSEEARTLGQLRVLMDGLPIWPTVRPSTDLEVFADDLLAFLVEVDPARAGAHNLADCFGGMYQLPPLHLHRRGPDLEVASAHQAWRLPWNEALAVFGQLGDTLAQRLAEDPKFERLNAAWAHRRPGWLAPASS